MTTFTDKLKVIVDFDTTPAQSSLGGLERSVAGVDTATGNMKTAGVNALGFIKANAIGFASAAGAAIAGFAVTAVGDFQKLALEAGDLAVTLGMTPEDASRIIEVAGDIGVGVDDLRTTIQKMNKEAENSPGKFDNIGASIVRNKDGVLDVKETFLNVVEALNNIPDAGTRAAAGAEIFGKGWDQIAVLIAEDKDSIVEAMKEVSDQDVISEDEYQKAKDLRDAIDEVKDKFKQLKLAAGEALAPVVTTAASFLGPIAEGIELMAKANTDKHSAGNDDKGVGFFSGPAEIWDETIDQWHAFTGGFREDIDTKIVPGLGEMKEKSKDASDSMTFGWGTIKDAVGDFSEKVQQSITDVDGFRTHGDEMLAALSNEGKWLSVQDAFDGFKAKALEAFDRSGKSAQEFETAQRNARQANIDLQTQVGAYITDTLGGIPDEKMTSILALIDEGKIKEAEWALARLTAARTVQIYPVLHAVTAPGGMQAFDSGGVVQGPAGAAVPAIVHAGETVLPTHKGVPTVALSAATIRELAAEVRRLNRAA